ncbi:hypothetical protein C9374_000893 [Naegleria lovaniensis]|uniref:Uncharacterized protein n=1 Tax=Naegleria lovaniensis TaxID=51637 RepID=A0AA88KMX9_NAELO|nr:uncharacterized protein C9374_000893 [Naegleria lovaniensis]KAG2388043.1 hypothetical protein C9374_000893 [Naegleria lovaniensis]
MSVKRIKGPSLFLKMSLSVLVLVITFVLVVCNCCLSEQAKTPDNQTKYFVDLEHYGKDLRNYTNLANILNTLPYEKEARSLIRQVLKKEDKLWNEFSKARLRLMICRKTIDDLRSELPRVDDEHKLIKHLDYIVQEEIKADDDDLTEMLTSAEDSTRTSQDDIKEFLQELNHDLEQYNDQYLKKVVMYEFGLQTRNRTITAVASILRGRSFPTALDMCKALSKELTTDTHISCRKIKKHGPSP